MPFSDPEKPFAALQKPGCMIRAFDFRLTFGRLQ
jgi:hypothetical protein